MILGLWLGCGTPHPCSSDGRPDSLDAFVDHLDTLADHAPIDAACLLSSLARPLEVEASRSLLSAQPGTREAPRLFVFSGDLVLTLVPDGVGTDLLEFGQILDATHSRKAELTFPLAPVSDTDALFERIRLGDGTNCRACHEQERPDFSSLVIRPDDSTRVDLDELRRQRCPAGVDCGMLEALFADEVVHRTFDPAFPTFDELVRQ